MPLWPLPPRILALAALVYITTKQTPSALLVAGGTRHRLIYRAVIVLRSEAAPGTSRSRYATTWRRFDAMDDVVAPHARGKPRARSLGIPFGGDPGR